MTDESMNDGIAVPGWFFKVTAGAVSLVTAAVIPWAYTVINELQSLRSEVVEVRIKVEQSAVFAADISHLAARVDRLERRIETIEQRQ